MLVRITIIFTNTPFSSGIFMIIKNLLYGICKCFRKKKLVKFAAGSTINTKTDLLFDYNVNVKLIRISANHKFSVYCTIKCLDSF